MKILLLSLVLVVVSEAQLSIPRYDLTQLQGQWKTMYLAASNLDKISENGPMRGYMRHIDVDLARRKISFNFFLKINGECTEKSVWGTQKSNKVITVDYEGKNDFQVVDVTTNSLLGYDVNVDEEGNTTELVLLIGRGQVDEKTVEKFKAFTRQKNIPEENIVKISDSDDCPVNEQKQ